VRGPDREGGEQGDHEVHESGRGQAVEKLVLEVDIKRDTRGHAPKLRISEAEVNPGC
jgi:hypothetical protein